MKWIQKKPPSAVLGLSLDGGRLEAVLLHSGNGSAAVQKTVSAPLTLDILHNETDVVGREIRNLLDAAGIKERRCVVAVPQAWVLTVNARIPEMEPADVPDFLQIEAERGFPYGLDELQIASVRHKSPGGEDYATQIGIPRQHLARLEAALTAADLKVVSFSLAITSLPGALGEEKRGIITLVVGETSAHLLLATGGSPVALRTLEGIYDTEDPARRIQTELIARELRITIGQLAPDIREGLRVVQVVGSSAATRQLADGLQPRVKSFGLSVEHVTSYPGPQFGMQLSAPGGVSGELSLAAQFLGRRPTPFEFLAPKPSFLEQMASRYSSRRLASVGVTAGVVALIVLVMFLVQQFQLSRLGSEWTAMKPKVTELEDLQIQIRKFRPWFDDSMANLTILKRVTEAFPEDGVVSAKSIEIRNTATVNCSGTTRDEPALLKTLEKLRNAKMVSDVRVDTIRGTSPKQFTFNFKWGEVAKP